MPATGWRRALMVLALVVVVPTAAAQSALFDSHVHLWDGEKSLQAYEAQLQENKLGPARFAAMWFGGPNQALAGDTAKIKAGNDGILALAARHPRMTPVVTVHPYDGQAALAELERVAKRGAKVLKIHPHTQQFAADDPRVLALVTRAGELGVIVLIDNANILPGDSEKMFNLALRAPGTKIIFAHMGGMNFRFWNTLKAARTAEGLLGDNIYFDVSAIVALVADSPVEQEFVWTMRNVGIDHILLGSDYPQFSLEQNADALNRLGLGEQELAKVRYQNANALLDHVD
ncbi:amidohydrolase family protein [Pseudoxanthomonas beigongshangi]